MVSREIAIPNGPEVVVDCQAHVLIEDASRLKENTMADIFHQFPINAPLDKVFEAVSTPAALDAWWTRHSSGKASEGEGYTLYFGPEYDWSAVVSRCVPHTEFEFLLSDVSKAAQAICRVR